jgi:ABC-type Co2+ transport system permease subunit
MLQLTYLLVVTTALVASHLAIWQREGRAAELLYNAYGTLALLVAALASANVQLPVGGSLETVSNVYLGVLWGLLALVNLLFTAEAVVRELDVEAADVLDGMRS